MKPKFLILIFVGIFSIILWVFVSFSEDYVTTVKVPIKFIDLKEGYAIREQSYDELSLTIKGEGWELAQTTFGKENDFRISTQKKIGKQVFQVRDEIANNSWLTSSLQVSLISPPQVELFVERINYKTVPIVHDLTLEYKPGYDLVSDISLTPDSILISGPKSLIKDIKSVKTKNMKFDNLDQDVSMKVEIDQLPYFLYEFRTTKVDFAVQKIVDKTFENVPVETKNVPPSRELSLYPSKIKVVVRGGIKMLGKLDVEDIKPYILFKRAYDDTLGAIEPMIDAPAFTKIIDHQPKRIEYIIKQY